MLSEEALGEYYYANSLDINNSTGDLYLLDPNNSQVLVFDPNGNYKFSFGSEGTGAGQLGKYSSVGISVDQTSGDVYVSESGGPFSNNRISKFAKVANSRHLRPQGERDHPGRRLQAKLQATSVSRAAPKATKRSSSRSPR